MEQSDRLLECEEWLEPIIHQAIDQAQAAGWRETEACAAIASLADHYMLSRQANAETDAAIRRAQTKATTGRQ